MTVGFYELQTSRVVNDDIKSPGFTTRWILTGETDDAAALAYVLANTEAILGGLWRQGIHLDPQGGGVWQVEVSYAVLEGSAAPAQSGTDPPASPPPPPGDDDPLGPEWSFSTTGGTTHITQSKLTTAKYGIGFDAAPNYKQAIGAGKDGSVAGVDVVARKFELSTTRLFPSISLNYLHALFQLTGTTNNADWLVFARGEVLFLGAEGQSKGENQGWSITYHFSCIPNVSSFAISPEITIAAGKWGHEYLWCAYADALDADSGRTVHKPIAAYVEQVYPEGDFSLLNI